MITSRTVNMRESIFFASIRSFFVALFAMIGLTFGIIPILILIGSLSTSTDIEKESVYTPEIVPNDQGIRKSLSKDAPVILKINIKGVIGSEALDMHSIRKLLVESREGSLKDRVKAVLVHLETPGGTVVDSDGIYRALKAYKEKYKTPIFAYVDGMCASGGMYVAAAADKIFASDVSIVGSIGVLSPSFFNVYELLEKLGVKSLTLTEGKGKDDLNPLRPWRPGEEDNFKELINYYYNHFVDVIVSNRSGIDKNKLVKEYGANIYPAKTAESYGYIDQSGYSLSQTLKALAQQIGIEDEYYQVIQLEKKTWYSELFKTELSLLKGQVKHQIVLSPETDPQLMNQFLYLYKP